MKDKTDKKKNDLLKAVKRERTRNYVILYTVTIVIFFVLLLYSFAMGYFTSGDFVANVVNNIIGILPPLLIFDFFNEKLSRDSSSIEMSNQITETLMSNPETLSLFTEEQRKGFIRSAIASIVEDEDATQMLDTTLGLYLNSEHNYRIRTEFDYNFELNKELPVAYNNVLKDKNNYFYVQEKFHYRAKYLSEESNNTRSGEIKIGFMFDNKSLDNVLHENKDDSEFDNCVFRESLDICSEDLAAIREQAADKEKFQKLFKFDLQVDSAKGVLKEVIVKEKGLLCKFEVGHDVSLSEHAVRIIFHMPKRWDSLLEVAIVDPTKAPRISVSYPEDAMDVDMFAFLSKGKEASLEVAHEHLNGIYDIAINNEWIYPISGLVFSVSKQKEECE